MDGNRWEPRARPSSHLESNLTHSLGFIVQPALVYLDTLSKLVDSKQTDLDVRNMLISPSSGALLGIQAI